MRAVLIAVCLAAISCFQTVAEDWTRSVFVELGYGVGQAKIDDRMFPDEHCFPIVSPAIGRRVSSRWDMGIRASFVLDDEYTYRERFHSVKAFGQYAPVLRGGFRVFVEPNCGIAYTEKPWRDAQRLYSFQTGVSTGIAYDMNNRWSISLRFMYLGTNIGNGRHYYTFSPGCVGRGWAIADFGLRTFQVGIRFMPFK